MRYLGVDLAWSDGRPGRSARETGVAAIDGDGRVRSAGWTRGVGATLDWILEQAGTAASIAVDAPLLLPNDTGARVCERDVARAFGRWKVAANPSSRALPWQAGRELAERLAARGVELDDGVRPVSSAVTVFECYPYTTLVGAAGLGYDRIRPPYKRLPRGVPAADARAARARVCDDLLRRVAALDDPPLDLASHPVTARLLDEPSPVAAGAYKHREDLLDAVLCAWTAAVRHREPGRMQVLGADDLPDAAGRRATILALTRPEQRRRPPPLPH